MGLLGVLGRIMQGKPIYMPEDQPKQTGAEQSVTPVRMQPPQIELRRVENEYPNGRYELRVDMKNEANEPLFLDKVTIFSVRREIDRELKPGETREISIYSGQPLQREPSGYLDLQYRTVNDCDYFLAHYLLRARPTQHGFEVDDFRLAGPIKDI